MRLCIVLYYRILYYYYYSILSTMIKASIVQLDQQKLCSENSFPDRSR